MDRGPPRNAAQSVLELSDADCDVAVEDQRPGSLAPLSPKEVLTTVVVDLGSSYWFDSCSFAEPTFRFQGGWQAIVERESDERTGGQPKASGAPLRSPEIDDVAPVSGAEHDRSTMGCCLLALFALISPRLALFLLWIFGDVLSRAFSSWIIPLLGFFFLPWTTLVYAAVWDWSAGQPPPLV